MAATTGTPRVSRRRSCFLRFWLSSNICGASSGVAAMRSLRLPPAKKVFFALVSTTPVMSAFSASRRDSVASMESL